MKRLKPNSFDLLITDLKKHEGLELFPYLDTADPPKTTIGYGRNLDDRGISEEEAEAMLRREATEHYDELVTALPWVADLPDHVQVVLANMAFNLGLTRLLQFRNMLAALESGDMPKAGSEMMDSRWATQVKGRAVDLQELLLNGWR